MSLKMVLPMPAGFSPAPRVQQLQEVHGEQVPREVVGRAARGQARGRHGARRGAREARHLGENQPLSWVHPKYSYLGQISTDFARFWTRRELQAHTRRPSRNRDQNGSHRRTL